MSGLFLPTTRTSQPSQWLPGAAQNSLARGLSELLIPHHFKTAIRGIAPTTIGTGLRLRQYPLGTFFGPASFTNNSNVGSLIVPGMGWRLTPPFTIGLVGVLQSTSSPVGLAECYANNNSGWRITATTQQLQGVVTRAGATVTITDPATTGVDTPFVLMFAVTATTTELFVNGVSVATGSHSSYSAGVNTLYVGMPSIGTTNAGGVALLAGWNRIPSAVEVREFAQNPWQICPPSTRQIWIPPWQHTFGVSIRRSFAAQPGTPTPLASSADSLTQGIVAAVNLGAGPVDVAPVMGNNRTLTKTNGPAFVPGGVVTNGSDSYLSRSARTGIAWVDEGTMLVVCRPAAVGTGNGTPIASFQTGGGSRGTIAAGIDSSGQACVVFITSNGAFYQPNTTAGSVVDKRVTIVVTKGNVASKIRAWVDGNKGAAIGFLSGNPAYSGSDSWALEIGRGWGNGNSANMQYFSGTTYLVLVWNRVLSDAEILRVSANPWQVFHHPAMQFLVAPSTYPSGTYRPIRRAAGQPYGHRTLSQLGVQLRVSSIFNAHLDFNQVTFLTRTIVSGQTAVIPDSTARDIKAINPSAAPTTRAALVAYLSNTGGSGNLGAGMSDTVRIRKQSSTSAQVFLSTVASGDAYSSTFTTPAGLYTLIVQLDLGGTGYTVYVDGKSVASGAFSGVIKTSTLKLQLGGNEFGNGPGTSTVLAYTIPGMLSPDQIKTLSANPWAIYQGRSLVAVDPAASAATTYTATLSLSAAIQIASSATASIDAAIQASQSASASIDLAVQEALSATASIDAAVQAAQTATSNIDAAVQAAQSASASVDTAVQASGSATASVDAAISQAGTASASVDAYVQASGTATASLDTAVQASASASASVDTAVQQAHTATAGVDTAVQAAGTATSAIDVAVQAQGTASASLDAYVQAPQNVTAALDVAIQAAQTIAASIDTVVQLANTTTASLDTAIQAAAMATASMNTYVQADGTVSAALNVAIQAEQSTSAGLDVAVQLARSAAASLDTVVALGQSATASLNAFIQAESLATASLDAAILAAISASASMDAAVQDARSAQIGLNAAIAVRQTLSAAMDVAVRASRTGVLSLSAYIYDPDAVNLRDFMSDISSFAAPPGDLSAITSGEQLSAVMLGSPIRVHPR